MYRIYYKGLLFSERENYYDALNCLENCIEDDMDGARLVEVTEKTRARIKDGGIVYED